MRYRDINERLSQRTTSAVAPPSGSSLLQRACACGNHAPGDECAECKRKRLQRSAAGPTPDVAPPIVHEVLRSPGQPLDAATRAFMEPRFGQDFSRVRVHTDAGAAKSAQAVSALAYTVGGHVAFASSQYAPGTPAGDRLIAHELAHVVQQRGGEPEGFPLVIDPTPALEAAAERASAGVHTPLTATTPAVMRQQPGGAQPRQTPEQVIERTRLLAAIRTQVAYMRLVGIVPSGPAGRPDSAQTWARTARSLVLKIFGEALNMEQVTEVVGAMRDHLSPGLRVEVAPTNDAECGDRAGYVRGLRPPVYLCPQFFYDSSPEEQIRTMIHEAAHLARIGNADPPERYCDVYDCETSCGGFDSADSWAHFVHCLSGAMPDKPETIEGSPHP